jgi:hypothetical protein
MARRGSADAVSGEQWKSTMLPNLLQKLCGDDTHMPMKQVYFNVSWQMLP